MASNYVKFRRGILSDFLKLTHYDDDTLYFITDESTNDIDIYLGSKKITDDIIHEDNGGGTSTFAGNLKDLNDVDIEEEALKNNDALVYSSILQKWTHKTIDTEILIIENTEGNAHIDAINSYFEVNLKTPKNGDIAIIKDPFTVNDETKYKHTSYIYNGVASHWEAFDGDYTAENVYFNNDFIVTEDIGTVTVDKSEGSTTLEASGKNLKELLSGLFAQEKNPTTQQPSAKIEWIVDETEYEVGTLFSPSYKLTLNEGSYSFDSDTEVGISYYTIKDNKNVTRASATEADIVVRTVSDSFADFQIEDNTNYYLTAAVDYNSGIIPKTNLGNEYPEGKIAEGTIENITTKNITGYRKCFYGALSVKEDISLLEASDIKTLAKSDKVDNRVYSLDIPEGSCRIVFACPQNLSKDELTSVKDVNGLGAEISDGFERYVIAIGGVNDYSPIDYNVFVLDYANPIAKKNTYEIVI